MRIAAGIIGVLLIVALIYFFLPVGVKRAVNPFYRGNATQTSPSPSSRPAAVSSNAPDAFLNVSFSPRPTVSASATTLAQATTRPTTTPRATNTATSSATTAALPGTGDEERNPELLVIQLLASILIIMFGYKLSKHI